MSNKTADLIAYNGKIATQNEQRSIVEAVAVLRRQVSSRGNRSRGYDLPGSRTQLINLNKRTVIPGLNDSHTHLIRGGLNYNLELRWMVCVARGRFTNVARASHENPIWTMGSCGGRLVEFQFEERRMPTLDELNKAAPDTPVFWLHLYDRALLNAPPCGPSVTPRNRRIRPRGKLFATRPAIRLGPHCATNAMILYATLAQGPKLPPEYQVNSSRHSCVS